MSKEVNNDSILAAIKYVWNNFDNKFCLHHNWIGDQFCEKILNSKNTSILDDGKLNI